MSCQFEQLYLGANGFVVRCKQCGQYQIGYLNICITISEADFYNLHELLQSKWVENFFMEQANKKSIYVPMPAEGVWVILTKAELKTFIYMLDLADSEIKALAMLNLF